LLADSVGQLNLSTNRKLDFALMVERHPDNVTAALVGGFAGSYLADLSPEDSSAAQVPLAEVLPEYPPDAGEDWGVNPPLPPKGISHFVQFGWAKEIKAVAVIPDFEVSTAKARGALQAEYKLKDCVSFTTGSSSCVLPPHSRRWSSQVFNLQRLAVLTTALSRSPPDPDLIFTAMQDRLHQPYRKHLVSSPSFSLCSRSVAVLIRGGYDADSSPPRYPDCIFAHYPARPLGNLSLGGGPDHLGSGHG
jgi:homoserine kinase